MKRVFSGRVGLALKMALAFGLLALAIHSNRDQLRAVLGRRPDFGLFLIGFVAYFAGLLLAFVRWFLLVRAVELPFRLRDALRLGFIGSLFNFVIPGAIGGDFVRAAYLCREQKRSARPIASVLVDRLAGLEGLFLLALIAGVMGWNGLEPPIRRLVTAAAIATAVTSAVVIVAFLPRRRVGRSKRRAELAAVGDAYRARFPVVLASMVMGSATHLLNVVAFYAVSRSIIPNAPGLREHLLIVPLVLFTTAIPLPFGALGVTEQISSRLFRLADSSGGAVGMMAFRLLQLTAALIGGAVYLANAAQVRELRQTASHLEADLVVEESSLHDAVRV